MLKSFLGDFMNLILSIEELVTLILEETGNMYSDHELVDLDESLFLPESHETTSVIVSELTNPVLVSVFQNLLDKHNVENIFLTSSYDELTAI